VPAARWIGQCLGYRPRNSHVKRFADAFEALAVARFAIVGEKDMGTIHLDEPGAILHVIFAKDFHLSSCALFIAELMNSFSVDGSLVGEIRDFLR
jgi:hypothetical protein